MKKNTAKFQKLSILLLVISDTRNEMSDKSGKVLEKRIFESGHELFKKVFLKDDKVLIQDYLKKSLKFKNVNAIILTGGTGLTGRDSTPEAVKKIITKEITGFGELIR